MYPRFALNKDYLLTDTVLNTYNTARKNNHLTKFEVALLGLTAMLTLVAIVLYFANNTYFEILYNPDGGFTGYVTVLLLITIFGVSVVYILRLARYRSIQFCLVFVLTGIASLLLVAQIMAGLPDLLHTSTHNLFKSNTTTLHTTASNIIKINEVGKIVLKWILIAAGAFYVLILPFIYRNNFNAKRFIDKTGIPIPHRNHIIAIMALAVLALMFSEIRDSEILQLNLSAIFLLILICPENIGVFRR